MIDCNVLQLRGTPGGFIGTEFGCRLFGHLYVPASAYVIQSTNGEGELCLFDTTFARELLKRPWPDRAELALYSNHPEGNMSPTEDDMENLALMPSGTHLFIVYEDECVERGKHNNGTDADPILNELLWVYSEKAITW